MCGENRFDTDPLLAADGSSPRVRGKQDTRRLLGEEDGLIPARAGKTESTPADCADASGSSPRVRGKHDSVLARRLDLGLIPARAGKTPTLPMTYITSVAHPRACGENTRTGFLGGLGRGSSPRVRGKLHET